MMLGDEVAVRFDVGRPGQRSVALILTNVDQIKTDWLFQRQKREHRRDRARRQRLLREDR
jgi:hypothetical protein